MDDGGLSSLMTMLAGVHPPAIPHPAAVPAPVVAPLPTGGQGIDWRALLQLTAPLIATMGGHDPSRLHFANGWLQGQQAAQQARQQMQERTDKKNQQGADYLMRVGEHAQTFDDPVALDNFLKLADDAGVQAGYTQQGALRGRFTVPQSVLADKRLKEISDQLDQLEKGGYSADDLAQSGAVLTLKNGTHVPVETAIGLTRTRPLDASGQPIAKPKPVKAASTEEERFIQKWAKENNTTVDDLTTDEYLAARNEYRDQSKTDKPPKEFAPGGVDSQFNDLVELWKTKHPGKEPPADVRTQLRAQANKVNDKETGLNGPAAQSALDPEGIAYAATEYRVTGKMPALGMGNGAARAAIINGAAQQAKTLGQTPAAAIQRQAAFSADRSALTKMRTMSSAAESFESKALAQADIIDGLSAKVDRTQYPIINGAILSGKTNLLGDSNAQQLANAVETFSAEYAKIMEGSTGSAAGSSDSARRASARLINTAMNKGTMRDVLALMRREMALTVQGYDATIGHITDRMGGTPPPSADAGPTAPRTYYGLDGKPITKPQ